MKLSAMIMSALLPGVDVFVKGSCVYLDVGDSFRGKAWRKGGALGVGVGGYVVERKLTKEPRVVVEWHAGWPGGGVRMRHEFASSSIVWSAPDVLSKSMLSICRAEFAAPPWAPPDVEWRIGDSCFRYVNGRTQDAGYVAYKANTRPQPETATQPS